MRFHKRVVTGGRIRTAMILALAALLPTAIWAGGGAEEGTDTLQPVTLMLDWVPNVNHVGIFVAQEDGHFENHGLDVRIIQPGEVFAPGAVVGGQAEFGVSFQDEVSLLRADNVPVVSIAALLQTNTSGFAVRAGEGVETPADFEGLTYGTFNSPYEEPTINSLVRCAGGDPSSIEFVTAGNDLLAMVQQGLADLVWIFYGTQGFQAQRIGLEIDYFPLNEYTECIPVYYTPVLISSEEQLDQSPDLARAFLAALSDAYEYVVANPVDAANTLADAVPELNRAELTQSVPWLAERMIMDAPQWGHQEESVWREYTEWLQSVGVISTMIEPDAAFTNEFLP